MAIKFLLESDGLPSKVQELAPALHNLKFNPGLGLAALLERMLDHKHLCHEISLLD